ncbi:shikimate dehydrogenase family protein [Flavihumibacter solisilvae]|uniref:Shikimate dehydrogenase n=1 Tax=Flavihumibacter solisilvae TaxID=1349421 RepID=A0A0C1KZ62_9BACT|nr:shikimate dehydrogenase [Flavihumibacter solisilvae]KIC92987.1 shikimate dehydrogenase [Flavihumibacter solisilvae]
MRKFGLIGYPLGHSFSKGYFTARFEKEGLNAIYENYPLEEIGSFPSLLQQEPLLEGLNVTIPYKEKIIPYLHNKSDVVQVIGACNCIQIRDGKLTGHNTDVIGFEKSLGKKLFPSHNKALVLGTGGASKAVQYVLDKLRIPFTVIGRTADAGKGIKSYEGLTRDELVSATLWINTTPLGMHPAENEMPPLDYAVLGSGHYLYDLIYNPTETKFLSMGRAAGAITENGHDMLIIQAEESWKIWNSPVTG